MHATSAHDVAQSTDYKTTMNIPDSVSSLSLSLSPSCLAWSPRSAQGHARRKSTAASSPIPVVSRIFSTTRLHNMSITLRHIQLPVRVLVKALLHCDATVLSSDTRAVLLRALPTKEEVAMLTAESQKAQLDNRVGTQAAKDSRPVGHTQGNTDNDDANVNDENKTSRILSICHEETNDHCSSAAVTAAADHGYYYDYDDDAAPPNEDDAHSSSYTAEDYMRHLVTCVADVRQRLQLWCAVEELEETVGQTWERVSAMQRAVCAVCDRHGCWARMLRVVLEFGNTLNRGTMHGGVTGFHLRSLSQLSMLKTNPVNMRSLNSRMDTSASMINNNTTNNDENDEEDDSGTVSSIRLSGLEVLVLCLMNSDAGKEVLRFVEDGEIAGRGGPLHQLRGIQLSDIGQQVTQLNYLMQKMRAVVAECADWHSWRRRRLPRYVMHSAESVGATRRNGKEQTHTKHTDWNACDDDDDDDDVVVGDEATSAPVARNNEANSIVHQTHESDAAEKSVIKDALPLMLSAALTRYLPQMSELALCHQRLREEVRAMLVSYGQDGSTSEETVVWDYVLQFGEEVRTCMARVRAGVICTEMIRPIIATPSAAVCEAGVQDQKGTAVPTSTESEGDMCRECTSSSACGCVNHSATPTPTRCDAGKENHTASVRRRCVASVSPLRAQNTNVHADPNACLIVAGGHTSD